RMSALGRFHLVYREQSQRVNRKLIELGLIASVQRSCLFSHSVLRKGIRFADTAALGVREVSSPTLFPVYSHFDAHRINATSQGQMRVDFLNISAFAVAEADHSSAAQERFAARVGEPAPDAVRPRASAADRRRDSRADCPIAAGSADGRDRYSGSPDAAG